MKKRTIILTVTGLGLATALFASNIDHQRVAGMGSMHKGQMMFSKIIKQLDLTDTQKEQLKSLKESKRKAMKEKFKALKEQRKELRKSFDASSFMTANHFDKESFKESIQKRREAMRVFMEANQDKMVEQRANTMEQVFNILTPEQREKLIQLSKKQ